MVRTVAHGSPLHGPPELIIIAINLALVAGAIGGLWYLATKLRRTL